MDTLLEFSFEAGQHLNVHMLHRSFKASVNH